MLSVTSEDVVGILFNAQHTLPLSRSELRPRSPPPPPLRVSCLARSSFEDDGMALALSNSCRGGGAFDWIFASFLGEKPEEVPARRHQSQLLFLFNTVAQQSAVKSTQPRVSLGYWLVKAVDIVHSLQMLSKWCQQRVLYFSNMLARQHNRRYSDALTIFFVV